MILVLWGKLYEMFPELHWQLLGQRDWAMADGAMAGGPPCLIAWIRQHPFRPQVGTSSVLHPCSSDSSERLLKIRGSHHEKSGTNSTLWMDIFWPLVHVHWSQDIQPVTFKYGWKRTDLPLPLCPNQHWPKPEVSPLSACGRCRDSADSMRTLI